MSRRAGPARERSDLRGPAGHKPLEKGAPHDRAPLLEPRGSAIAVPAQAQAVIDQSHTSPHNLGAALNECCGFSSQSFTSSVTGDSVAVSVNIIGRDGSEALLRLDIETAEDGLPTGAVLGSAVLPTAGSLIGDMVFLGAPVPLTAGAEYAIVARYENAPPPGPGSGQGHWTGSSGNIYTRGQHVSHDGTRWLYDGLGFDLHFITWMGGGDLDGDGWFAPDDCDDNDAAVYPGALKCGGTTSIKTATATT